MDLKIFQPIINLIPEVEVPKIKPDLKGKLIWTGIALLIFTILGIVNPIGAMPMEAVPHLQNLQQILASRIGSLATLGIGPIVMASIILQLLNGAGILGIDMQDPEQKKLFMGFQKLFALAFCVFQAVIYVSSGFIPAQPGVLTWILLVAQIAGGAIIIMYLDEIVNKYGIGSGVGLFIAAGVSDTIIWRAFSWLPMGGTYVGLVPQLIQGLTVGTISEAAIMPLIFTVLVFFAVVFAESMKIEIPLTFGRIRGMGARYPLKFLYVSNIPVILAAALLANVQLAGVALNNVGAPVLGEFDAQNQPMPGGFAYYAKAPYGAFATPSRALISLTSMDVMLNILVYGAIMLTLCIIFGKFWVEMSNMDAKSVAKQLQKIGLHVPGFRRDPRVVEKVLMRYIPVITILGAISVGLLAVFADLTGALGTGTGILLTVGILYKMYEELASEQAFEMMPGLKGLMS